LTDKTRRPGLLAAAPYAVFAVLTAVSWNRWIEPFVDSGRELMVPWRLAHGERLYRDVAFYHGPLGPWLAALADLVAGRSLNARILLSAAIALLHVEGLRRVALRVTSEGRAALAACLAVALTAFLRPGGWLFPFSLDASIAVASLTWSLVLVTEEGTKRRDGAAGAFLAAALLCRIELGALGVFAAMLAARRSPRRWLPLAAWPCLAAAVSYTIVSRGTSFSTLVGSGWLAVVKPPSAFRTVYRAYAGLDQPGLRLAELGLASIALLGIGALLALGSRSAGPHRIGSRVATATVTLTLAALAWTCLRPPEHFEGTLALLPPLVRIVPPLVVFLLAIRIGRALLRRPPAPLSEIPMSALIVAAFFAMRLFLAAGYAGPYNAYFLPLPALVATVAVLGLADRAAAQLGPLLPGLAARALAVFLLFRIAALADFYRQPGWAAVPTPAGSVTLLTPAAETTRLALEDLSRRLPAGGSLVGFPEGGFFNYVLGARSPLREEQFFPGRLDAEGERQVARRLEENPPDAVLSTNVLAVGEGARAFGKDYSVELAAAVNRRFRVAAAFGPGAGPEAAVGDPQFFILIRVPEKRAP
jgi:Dolichyl-phosphate-mannose-protein mannosyltransferase